MNLAEKIAALKAEIEEKRTNFNSFVQEARVKAEADDLKSAKELKSKAETVKTEMSEAEQRLKELEELAELNPITVQKDERKKIISPVDFSTGTKGEERDKSEFEKQYKPLFLRMIRSKGNLALTSEERDLLQTAHVENRDFAGISGLTGPDGGYTIPQDISTKINQLVQTLNPLQQYVNVQNVNTRTGSRVLEKRATMTPFEQVAETGTIQTTDKPQLVTVTYSIKDFAGMLPLSNTALADSDENLIQYIANWFAQKSVVTRNSLILAELQKNAIQQLGGTDEIKKVLNVTLDPAISQSAVILTNQNGFNFLDTLKDSEGRYLLQPNPSNPTTKLLFGRPVVTVANNTLPDVEAGAVAPIFIGDFKEGVILWDRQQQSIALNPYNDSSWNTNTTSMRAIEREDCTQWDAEAYVYGQLEISPGTAGTSSTTSSSK